VFFGVFAGTEQGKRKMSTVFSQRETKKTQKRHSEEIEEFISEKEYYNTNNGQRTFET
jgi:hypothetical protein